MMLTSVSKISSQNEIQQNTLPSSTNIMSVAEQRRPGPQYELKAVLLAVGENTYECKDQRPAVGLGMFKLRLPGKREAPRYVDLYRGKIYDVGPILLENPYFFPYLSDDRILGGPSKGIREIGALDISSRGETVFRFFVDDRPPAIIRARDAATYGAPSFAYFGREVLRKSVPNLGEKGQVPLGTKPVQWGELYETDLNFKRKQGSTMIIHRVNTVAGQAPLSCEGLADTKDTEDDIFYSPFAAQYWFYDLPEKPRFQGLDLFDVCANPPAGLRTSPGSSRSGQATSKKVGSIPGAQKQGAVKLDSSRQAYQPAAVNLG